MFGYVAKANTFYLAENSSSASISDTTETGNYINGYTAGYYCNSTGLGLIQKKLSVGSNTCGEIGSLFDKSNEMYIGLNGSKSAKLKDVGNYTLSYITNNIFEIPLNGHSIVSVIETTITLNSSYNFLILSFLIYYYILLLYHNNSYYNSILFFEIKNILKKKD